MTNDKVKRAKIVKTSDGKRGLEVSDTLEGCFVRLPAPNGNGKWQSINGPCYSSIINLGKGNFLFTTYWEGTIPKKFIETPVHFI